MLSSSSAEKSTKRDDKSVRDETIILRIIRSRSRGLGSAKTTIEDHLLVIFISSLTFIISS